MFAKLASSSAAQAAIAGLVALLLLISGAVAIDRVGAPDGPTTSGARPRPLAAPPVTPRAQTPGSQTPGSQTPGSQTPESPALSAQGPVLKVAPVTGPVPVRVARRTPGVRRPVATAAVEELAAPAPAPAVGPERSEAASSPGPGRPAPTAAPEPPAPPAPEPAPFLRVSASLGDGVTGAVARLAVPQDVTPGGLADELDLTLGTVQVIGDAPPARGTSVELGGTAFPDLAGGRLQA